MCWLLYLWLLLLWLGCCCVKWWLCLELVYLLRNCRFLLVRLCCYVLLWFLRLFGFIGIYCYYCFLYRFVWVFGIGMCLIMRFVCLIGLLWCDGWICCGLILIFCLFIVKLIGCVFICWFVMVVFGWMYLFCLFGILIGCILFVVSCKLSMLVFLLIVIWFDLSCCLLRIGLWFLL